MATDLTGRVVVVTGAGSGIGRCLSLAFAAEGAHVVAADLNLPTATETAALATGRHPVTAFRLDVTDLDGWRSLKDTVDGRHGACDVLCNNAGVYFDDLYLDSTLQQWRRLCSVNISGVMYGCDTFVPAMVARGTGHIVNTASIQGLIGVPQGPYYSASKFAVVGFTQSLAGGLEGTGVTASVLCPDVIDTPMNADVDTTGQRLIAPEEVARRVVVAVRADTPPLYIFTSRDYLDFFRDSIAAILNDYEATEG